MGAFLWGGDLLEMRQVVTQKGTLTYGLTRKKVKNINLRIRQRDGSVQVSAPYRTNVGFVDEFVAVNSDFVFNALKKHNEAESKKQRLLNNEEVYYLGKCYKVIINKADKNDVELTNNQIVVAVTDDEKIKSLLETWLDGERNRVFNEAFERIYLLFELMGINKPELVFKSSISRWGYCQPKKSLVMMNKALIGVPVYLIEYLVLHELTHLIYPNHSKNFWGFMEKYMPDCKKRRNLLQKYNFLL